MKTRNAFAAGSRRVNIRREDRNMSTAEKSKTEEGALTEGAGNGGAGAGTLGEMSVQQLLKALTVITLAGKEPPRLEGNPVTKEDIKVFIDEYDEYCEEMRWGVSGEMPRNLVGVMELLEWPQRRVIKGIHNNGMELKNQV